ncbi:hypothetical protein [Streptomyces sp. NPDC014676]|uniref:hypothetical protein n=1 Tax=Streptomyces sp. NPDC014676 TaxID=3364879 RepID=UPI003701B645
MASLALASIFVAVGLSGWTSDALGKDSSQEFALVSSVSASGNESGFAASPTAGDFNVSAVAARLCKDAFYVNCISVGGIKPKLLPVLDDSISSVENIGSVPVCIYADEYFHGRWVWIAAGAKIPNLGDGGWINDQVSSFRAEPSPGTC